MTDGALQPYNPNLGDDTESLHVNPGSSPSFVTAEYTTPGPNEWCAMVSRIFSCLILPSTQLHTAEIDRIPSPHP